jgi:predicted Rossmann fold nucleotide-binding protein DprA/Smf involved in DNA uptake
VADFLKQTLKDIEARKRELQPLVDEYNQLAEAAAALQGGDGASAGTSPAAARSRPTRRRGRRASASTGTGRRGRPRGSGKRAQQALDLVKDRPGITIPELAKAMKIQPNYLYRVLPGLEKDGKVKRKDKGWQLA